MKNISGVEFKRDVSGKAKSVTIDLQKHGEALQFFLEQVGALSEEENFVSTRSAKMKHSDAWVKVSHAKPLHTHIYIGHGILGCLVEVERVTAKNVKSYLLRTSL